MSLSTTRVGDFWRFGIRAEVTCSKCGRVRYLRGGELEALLGAEDRLSDDNAPKLRRLAGRLVCGLCETRWPTIRLVEDPQS